MTKFVPDQPISGVLQDQLDLKLFSDRIWQAIQYTDPPFVFGLMGDWGSGKTSALSILQDQIRMKAVGEHSCYFVPIWFNAWIYENEANIIYPLLHSIKKNYEDRFQVLEKADQFSSAFKKVTYVSTMAISDLAIRSVTNHIVGESLSLNDLVKRLEEFEEKSDALDSVLNRWANDIDNLKDAFEKLLYAYATALSKKLKNDGDNIDASKIRFVILIDDLDRCLPQTAISILENIKNFLSIKSCIYVLALNQKVIYQGIATKYQGLNINGRQYLEKIVNYSFYIPQPKDDILGKFVVNSLKDLAPDLLDENTRIAFDNFGHTLKECHFNNPRKIKRVLNQYLLYLSTNLDVQKLSFLNNITKLIIMGEYYPEIYQLFVKSPEKAKNALSKLGGMDFSLDDFKDIQGINIIDSYIELKRVKPLFDIDLSIAIYPIEMQIQDVNNTLNIQRCE